MLVTQGTLASCRAVARHVREQGNIHRADAGPAAEHSHGKRQGRRAQFSGYVVGRLSARASIRALVIAALFTPSIILYLHGVVLAPAIIVLASTPFMPDTTGPKPYCSGLSQLCLSGRRLGSGGPRNASGTRPARARTHGSCRRATTRKDLLGGLPVERRIWKTVATESAVTQHAAGPSMLVTPLRG
jgi:hypothetical protein